MRGRHRYGGGRAGESEGKAINSVRGGVRELEEVHQQFKVSDAVTA